MSQPHSREVLASRLKAVTTHEGSSEEVRLLAESILWVLAELGQVKASSANALKTAQIADTKAGRPH